MPSVELAWNVQPAICWSVAPDKILVAAGAVVVATNNSPTEIPAIVLALPVIGKVPDKVAEAVISAASLMFNLTESPTVGPEAILPLRVRYLVSPEGIFQERPVKVALWVLVFKA